MFNYIDWTELWMNLFGTTEWYGLNVGFWVGMGITALIVVIMNVVFWCMKSKKKD